MKPVVRVEIVATADSRRRTRDADHSLAVRDDSLERYTDSVVRRLHRYMAREQEHKRSLRMEIDMLYEIVEAKHRRIKELENDNTNRDAQAVQSGSGDVKYL